MLHERHPRVVLPAAKELPHAERRVVVLSSQLKVVEVAGKQVREHAFVPKLPGQHVI